MNGHCAYICLYLSQTVLCDIKLINVVNFQWLYRIYIQNKFLWREKNKSNQIKSNVIVFNFENKSSVLECIRIAIALHCSLIVAVFWYNGIFNLSVQTWNINENNVSRKTLDVLSKIFYKAACDKHKNI